MSEALDFKKKDKALYQPATTPGIIDVPSMRFLMVDGQGDPNTAQAYADAVEALYGLSYAIKMSKMGGQQPAGYFDYVVPPLEGLWWTQGAIYDGVTNKDKSQFCWTSLLRQPEFVTAEVLQEAQAALRKKKPGLDTSLVRLVDFTEGLCVQVMHLGPYDAEPATVAQMDAFVAVQGYHADFSDTRHHHEIYLSDPRKTAPEKLKTVIRHPVRK